jgi:adenylate cyclase
VSDLLLDDVAGRGGSTPSRVRRLVELGVVPDRGGDDGFDVTDIQRVRLAEALDRAGIPFDALGQAVADGALTFDFLETVLPAPPTMAARSFRQEASRLGLPVETLVGLYPAWGLPRPSPDDPVRADEEEVFDEFAKFVALGAIEEQTLRRAASVTGESARRIANWGTDLFRALVDEPIRRGGGGPRQILDAATVFAAVGEGSLERQFVWLLRRALEHHTLQYVVELVEEAIEAAGIRVPRQAHPPAIAFVDLSGYTAMTEQLGDEAAADRSLTLARVVQEPVGRHGGQVVKTLGDGVLLHFGDPAAAVRCALELVATVPASGLPEAHAGVSAGPVVWRDGDCFGRAVNVASRTVGVARPGQVVVTEDVVEASTRAAETAAADLAFDALGPHTLKGVADPVMLFAARPR